MKKDTAKYRQRWHEFICFGLSKTDLRYCTANRYNVIRTFVQSMPNTQPLLEEEKEERKKK
jgi:hypothetical protein